MTNMKDYNGYHNRATWNVALWLNNDESMYRAMQSEARRAKPTAGNAKRFCCNLFGEATPDGCKLKSVKWSEIAEVINEERTA